MKDNYLIFVLFIIGFIFLSGCAKQEVPEVIEPIIEEVPGIEEIVAPEPIDEIIEEVSDLEIVKTVPEEIIDETKCRREFSPQFNSEPYYNGSLFDAHFHMPNLIDRSKIPEGHGESYEDDHGPSVTDTILGKEAELDTILCTFEKENVKGAIGFAIGGEQLLDETLTKARDIKEESSEKINLFLMPSGFSTETLENIQESDSGLFKGYGEMAFYDPSYTNIPPDSPKVMEIYEVARKNNLIVMMHPDGRQESKVENAVRKNPDVTFLIHGPEIENSVTNLINKYPNVYYSIDAILIRLPNVPGALMYMVSDEEEFKLKFTQNFDTMLNDAVKKWKDRIEKNPDRFMWGTDRSDKWTFDEEVSVLLEEFGRAFIGRLDPQVQEKFAYGNAEELLEE